MSLDWNLTEIENHEEVCWIDDGHGGHRLSPVTETLILMTIPLGMTAITPATVEEYATRIAMIQDVDGGLLLGTDPETGDRTDVRVTTADVYAHVGLRTNASSRTRGSFLKTVYDTVKDRVRNEEPSKNVTDRFDEATRDARTAPQTTHNN